MLETDSPNPWSSIKHSLRTTEIEHEVARIKVEVCVRYVHILVFSLYMCVYVYIALLCCFNNFHQLRQFLFIFKVTYLLLAISFYFSLWFNVHLLNPFFVYHMYLLWLKHPLFTYSIQLFMCLPASGRAVFLVYLREFLRALLTIQMCVLQQVDVGCGAIYSSFQTCF